MTNIHQIIEETEDMLDAPTVSGELRDNVQEIIGNFYEVLKVLSLMPDSDSVQATIDAMGNEIGRLIEERDEARRNLCLSEAADLSFGESGVPYHSSVAHKIAADYGWDCFDNNPCNEPMCVKHPKCAAEADAQGLSDSEKNSH